MTVGTRGGPAQWVNERAVQDPDAVALVDASGRTWSYDTLDRTVSRCAGWLWQRGVRPGAVVCVSTTDPLVTRLLRLGSGRIGAVEALLDPSLPKALLAARVARVGSRHLMDDALVGGAALGEPVPAGSVILACRTSRLDVPTTSPSNRRPAPSFSATWRARARSTSCSAEPPACRHATSIVRGSTVRRSFVPLSLVASRSTIPSRKYCNEESAPLTRNGTAATTFGSSPADGACRQRGRANTAAVRSATSTDSEPISRLRPAGWCVPEPVAAAGAAATGPGARLPDSAAANSAAVAKRSAGTLASAFRTARSSASGTDARRVCRGGTGSTACRAITAMGVMPEKGGSPASISYMTHPTEYMSLRPSTWLLPPACSGDM
jgi:hypothetical protein